MTVVEGGVVVTTSGVSFSTVHPAIIKLASAETTIALIKLFDSIFLSPIVGQLSWPQDSAVVATAMTCQ